MTMAISQDAGGRRNGQGRIDRHRAQCYIRRCLSRGRPETKMGEVLDNIISLDDKLKLSTVRKAALARKRKILAVRKIFQCTQCSAKCERCGATLSPETQSQTNNPRIPYNFCDSCADEYVDYIAQLQGKGDIQAYWHNDEWMRVWQSWIEYQGATDAYLRSKAFQQLLEELRTDIHDNR